MESQPPYPAARKSWAIVLIFCLASIVSVIDRGILTLVIDPIRHDLAISDVKIGLLQGLSFGLFYSLVGLPLGMMADRVSRHRLLIFGVTTWSLATLCGGLAANFGQLFAARLLVGLGEATLGPCAVSMIADLFPPEKRGRPISIYLMGQAIAGGLGIFVTGLVIRAAGAGAFVGLPLIAGLAPWRLVFIFCGLFGLVVVALLLTFREPVRRGAKLSQGASIRAALAYLRANAGLLVPLYVGYAIVVMHSYGMGAWNATFLIRRFGMTAAEVGQRLGTAAMIAGCVGAVTAGILVDRFSRTGGAPAKLRLFLALAVIALPSTLIAVAPNPTVGIILIALTIMITPMWGTTIISLIQEILPNNMRGLGISLLGLTNTLFGSATAPLLIAAATEHLYHNPKAVGWAISTVSLPALVIGSALVLVALIALRRATSRNSAVQTVLAHENDLAA
jgi:MFS family permease